MYVWTNVCSKWINDLVKILSLNASSRPQRIRKAIAAVRQQNSVIAFWEEIRRKKNQNKFIVQVQDDHLHFHQNSLF